jgi:hypothetical protein
VGTREAKDSRTRTNTNTCTQIHTKTLKRTHARTQMYTHTHTYTHHLLPASACWQVTPHPLHPMPPSPKPTTPLQSRPRILHPVTPPPSTASACLPRPPPRPARPFRSPRGSRLLEIQFLKGLEALQRGGEGPGTVVADLIVAAARRAGEGGWAGGWNRRRDMGIEETGERQGKRTVRRAGAETRFHSPAALTDAVPSIKTVSTSAPSVSGIKTPSLVHECVFNSVKRAPIELYKALWPRSIAASEGHETQPKTMDNDCAKLARLLSKSLKATNLSQVPVFSSKKPEKFYIHRQNNCSGCRFNMSLSRYLGKEIIQWQSFLIRFGFFVSKII